MARTQDPNGVRKQSSEEGSYDIWIVCALLSAADRDRSSDIRSDMHKNFHRIIPDRAIFVWSVWLLSEGTV